MMDALFTVDVRNLDQNPTILWSELVQVGGLLPSTRKRPTLNLSLSGHNLLSGPISASPLL
jgi:hypothetical protein